MFRHRNLRMDAAQVEPDKEEDHPPAADRSGEPAGYPDAYGNEDWLVFLHGYNVNGEDARGWHSEMFKRFFWSGNRDLPAQVHLRPHDQPLHGARRQ